MGKCRLRSTATTKAVARVWPTPESLATDGAGVYRQSAQETTNEGGSGAAGEANDAGGARSQKNKEFKQRPMTMAEAQQAWQRVY